MKKYDIQIYATLILIIVTGFLTSIGYHMVKNLVTYKLEGIPTSDFFRIISSDYTTYYLYSWLFLIVGIIGLIIGAILLIIYVVLQHKEPLVKSEVKNISTQNYIKSMPINDEAINILRTRYAKGEITIEQYQKMRKNLEG